MINFLNKVMVIVLVLLGLFIVPSADAWEKGKIKAVFLNIATPDDFWWNSCTSYMQAAAANLGIDLKVYRASRNRDLMISQAKEAVSGAEKPDFLIFSGLKENIPEILKIAEANKVKSFIFNNSMDDLQKKEYGGPREKFKFWIGQMQPSDMEAGYNLAKILAEKAKEMKLQRADGKIEFFAITGVLSDSAAKERNKGFTQFTKERKDVVFNRGFLPGNWKKDEGKSVFGLAYKDFKNTNAVWNANDNMAMGVIEAVRNDFGKQPGKDILVGGIDWNSENLEAIRKGDITASIGGHFIEGAWVMVLISDYFNGIDFAKETLNFSSSMGAITKKNVGNYFTNLTNRKPSDVNWKKFSKKHNPKLKKYSFTPNVLLN